MNSRYFVYKHGDIVTNPNIKQLEKVQESMIRVVVAIIGKYNAMVSGLHLGLSEVMSYHSEDFHPKEALIGRSVSVPVKVLRHYQKHHTYQTLTPPSSSIIGIADEIDDGDLVFQVGVRNHLPGIITIGVVDKISKYVDIQNLDDSLISDTSESGSGVFTYDGKLIGMTLGIISPEVMIAISIDSIILMDRPILTPKPWFYNQNE